MALMVGAIDFGTTYSGYAFSFRNDFERDPLKVSASTWISGSRANISLKTSSCILFNPTGQFDSFGLEAEDKYNDLTLDKKHADWFFFGKFKMLLYNTKNVHRKTKIKDETGKEMLAMDVFATAIRYLKEHLINACNPQKELNEREIRWVLTVPAIWDDGAKQFMREAAEKAGIAHESLVLALEPEAASMFCMYLPVERIMGSSDMKVTCFKPSSRYMVLDAGGGTIDITVHEVQDDGSLRELCKPNGGPWGGTAVDQAYLDFIQNIAGSDVMEIFRNQHRDDYIDLLREFEVKKRSVQPDMDTKVTFKIPITLHELYRKVNHKEIRETVRDDPNFANKVTFAGDKMRVEAEVVKSFFNETVQIIIRHIKDLLDNPQKQGVNSILMVGGFSESAMLRESIQRSFPKLSIIVPSEAALAVLKGAVIFGHNPNVITSRVAKYTYGCEFFRIYDPDVHPKEKMELTPDGKKVVRKGFDKIVESGQSVSPNEPSTKKTFPPNKGCDVVKVKLFASPRKDPMFVDETDCIYIGELRVKCVDNKGERGKISFYLFFGGTELEIRAEHTSTKEQTRASFNFLN